MLIYLLLVLILHLEVFPFDGDDEDDDDNDDDYVNTFLWHLVMCLLLLSIYVKICMHSCTVGIWFFLDQN